MAGGAQLHARHHRGTPRRPQSVPALGARARTTAPGGDHPADPRKLPAAPLALAQEERQTAGHLDPARPARHREGLLQAPRAPEPHPRQPRIRTRNAPSRKTPPGRAAEPPTDAGRPQRPRHRRPARPARPRHPRTALLGRPAPLRTGRARTHRPEPRPPDAANPPGQGPQGPRGSGRRACPVVARTLPRRRAPASRPGQRRARPVPHQLRRAVQSRRAQPHGDEVHQERRGPPRRKLPSAAPHLRHPHARRRRGHPLHPAVARPREARNHRHLHRGEHRAAQGRPRPLPSRRATRSPAHRRHQPRQPRRPARR